MSYTVEYINCKICGSDLPKILGLRGNLEFSGAPALPAEQEHIVTNVVRCRKCRFVYTNPMIILDSPRGYNNPSEYKPSAGNIESGLLFRDILKLIEKYAPNGKLLDIGCGRGEFLAIAKENGWEVYGLELSREFADYVHKKYSLNIELKKIEDAKFPNNFFDAVTLNMVLEHMDNPKLTIIEINRILKKKGVLFIEVPNTDGLMLKLASLYFRLNKKDWSPLLSPLHYPFHTYGYNISSLKYLLDNCNFKIKKFIFSDSSLRGIRNSPFVNRLEKWLCRAATRISGLLGKGDILNVIVLKDDI